MSVSGAGSGDFGQCHLLAARTLGDAGWTHHPGATAGGDRWPFWPRTAPLRAAALSSGAVDAAAADRAAAIAGRVDLETPGATPADRQTGRFRQRGTRRVARRAGDLALCIGGRSRCAPCRQERVLHADRQCLVPLGWHALIEEPTDFPRSAARRAYRLWAQRRALQLHAPAFTARFAERPTDGRAAELLR